MATNIDIYVERLAAHENRIGAVEEHQRIAERRDVVQFVVAVIVIVCSIFGAGGFLGWQNAKLIEQIDKRIEQIEKRLEQNERNFDARIDVLEKNTNMRMVDLRQDLTARFEDLKQVVLSQRK